MRDFLNLQLSSLASKLTEMSTRLTIAENGRIKMQQEMENGK